MSSGSCHVTFEACPYHYKILRKSQFTKCKSYYLVVQINIKIATFE